MTWKLASFVAALLAGVALGEEPTLIDQNPPAEAVLKPEEESGGSSLGLQKPTDFVQKLQAFQEEIRVWHETQKDNLKASYEELVELWKATAEAAERRFQRAKQSTQSDLKDANEIWTSFFDWLKNLIAGIPVPLPVTGGTQSQQKAGQLAPISIPQIGAILEEMHALLEAVYTKVLQEKAQLLNQEEQQPQKEGLTPVTTESPSSEVAKADQEVTSDTPQKEQQEEQRSEIAEEAATPTREEATQVQQEMAETVERQEDEVSEPEVGITSEAEAGQETVQEAVPETAPEAVPETVPEAVEETVPEAVEETVQEAVPEVGTENVQEGVQAVAASPQQAEPEAHGALLVVAEPEASTEATPADDHASQLSTIVLDTLNRIENAYKSLYETLKAAIVSGSRGSFRAPQAAATMLKELEELGEEFAEENAAVTAELAAVEEAAQRQGPTWTMIEREKVLKKWLVMANIQQVKITAIGSKAAAYGISTDVTPVLSPSAEEQAATPPFTTYPYIYYP
ncbi:hypothetical protein cyc_06261 [Cyclospora cayetanensis]|uniref:Uncharacterized protein n=1 Tax=Cyclospora cayetanensis TaxID=88456 RepID=A0A1D3DAY7_9EIME|nr:hypothetical protein cyc_06261 [Cyclospora cayetanensis]